jgi:hypothetical protein
MRFARRFKLRVHRFEPCAFYRFEPRTLICCKAPCQTPQIGTKQLTVNSQIETNGAGTIPRHPWDGNVGLATNTSGHTAVLELN